MSRTPWHHVEDDGRHSVYRCGWCGRLGVTSQLGAVAQLKECVCVGAKK